MTDNGQLLTKQSYENPQLVAEFIKKHSLEPKQAQLIQEFSSKIKGKKVLDLGCGPGHDSYLFAELGYEVTGLDYSSEMIKQAKKLKETTKNISFIVGDMTQLDTYFEPNTFDAVWASASLLHIPTSQIEKVLAGIANVSAPGANVYISLKGGSGTHLVSEDQYLDGIKVEREFTLWEKETFLELAEKYGFILSEFDTREGRVFQGQPTKWLMFFFTVKR
ncbi:MAG TPA: class I SAM-dependent methyltransferase [Patescibacteria group bacterium]